MTTTRLIARNLTFFWRTNAAVLLGVATASAVLGGALLVGASVRASLRTLFLGRLGQVDHVISSTAYFRESLAADLASHPDFRASFARAAPIVALEGSVVEPERGGRAFGIDVFGVDERFWRLHAARPPGDFTGRQAWVSASLAAELAVRAGASLLVRVPRPSDVPAGLLHGRRDLVDIGRTMRVTVQGVLGAESLGEFSLRLSQGPARGVFVPMSLLQRTLDRRGEVNTILIAEHAGGSATEQRGRAVPALETILRERFTIEDLGLRVRPVGQTVAAEPTATPPGATAVVDLALEAETLVLPEAVTAAALEAARQVGAATTPVFTYLANTIRAGGREIPYSLVTAMDLTRLVESAGLTTAEVGSGASADTGLPPIVLNEWAVSDLGIGRGPEVQLDYFVWEEAGRLGTGTQAFRLAAIVPMRGLAADPDLAPLYPGITESRSLSEWDPPFPVDLKRVRPRDEEYWDRFRTRPKAFIPIDVGQRLWASRHGKVTSIRLHAGDAAARAAESFTRELRRRLDPFAAGLALAPVRTRGLEASEGATDFGAYFTYFSFFLVVSAVLLAALFFKLGVEQRLAEVGLLRAVGFSLGRVRRIFLAEGLLLSVVGAAAGAWGAVGYAALMMMGLTTWWVDATGTRLLTLHVTARPLVLGAAGGVVSAAVCLWWTLGSLARVSPRNLLAGTAEPPMVSRAGQPADETAGAGAHARFRLADLRRWAATSVLALAGLALVGASARNLIADAGGFFAGGTLLLAAMLTAFGAWVRTPRVRPITGHGWPALIRLGFRNAAVRPGRSTLSIALVASATFIIVAVEAFRLPDDAAADRRGGTGGFALVADSLLPLHHDPGSAEGRDALGIDGTATPGGGTADLRGIVVERFRVRGGDDTSCLNLFRPRDPRVLAPTPQFIEANRFSFGASLAETAAERANPWRLLDRRLPDDAVPVIADGTSATYVLHLGLGDDFILDRGGAPVRLRLVGTLERSIFQGEFLMSERNFLSLFPGEEGFRRFLIEVDAGRAGPISAALEARLADYGFDVTSAPEKLAAYSRVENTYLTTFQLLGALGLLLGTLGLATVLVRNVLERRRELALLRAVGYDARHMTVMVVTENVVLLAGGLAAGVACAAVAVTPALVDRGGEIAGLGTLGLLAAVAATGLSASVVATVAALRSPLLAALRGE